MTNEAGTPVDEAAVAWFARLRDPEASAAERAACAAWLAADPAHRAAWSEVDALWHGLDGLEADFAALPTDRPARPARRPLAVAAAIALLLLLAATAGLWTLQPPGFAAGLLADAQTGLGERRRIALPDGSSVVLAAASALSTDFEDGRRRVTLLRGEAFFSVAPHPDRPFVVEAGAGSVTVVGTAFDVALRGRGTSVSVASGRVAVTPEAGPPVRLSPGQGLRYGPEGAGAPYPVAAADIGAWREGRLVFEAAPLAEVLHDLERYRRGRILVTDPAIAALPVTGVFDTRRPEAALETIARSLPVRLLYLTDLLVLVRPAG
ncbi:FecR family protein [Tistlia consotensis]|uniref:FecR family protein n=1 Tax=Tistlia consotensis USBA 355 TaxID=560819 RepID=A0A1Y6BP47_9PROT|nr:FecR domain-containing protein [Tistlia consotensis]SMF13590.1 FecR family protein [Tistlia consotensis USBA 355]SNR50362.1 FecR family protein [Tistlia consotensis]